ncbi:MAG: hypothetical protein Q8J78_14085 [Moraxellaceae bacterium]|nr:hypothetical protein [Moraxellaceae bacterium]
MSRLLMLLLGVFLFAFTGCSTIWAQAMAGRMTDSLLSMESYRGRLVQQGLLPDAPGTPVVQDVVYAKPWRVRAEVMAPAAYKGSLFVYDGEQMLMWWPQELMGIRVRGLKNPSRDEIAAHVQREMKNAMEHYAFALTEGQKVAGHEVSRWRVLPLAEAPYRLHHTSWNYDRYAFPLKMEFQESGKPWYSYAFEKIEFGVPVQDSEFAFTFPENAVVFEWDMQAPGISLEEARRKMNFTVMQPKKLPDGHALRKIVRAEHCLPMIALQFDRGASLITLTQSRAYGPGQVPRYGKPVKIGDSTGWLYFAGTTTVISWVRDKTALTLMGNLSFPQMISIARSVE